MVYKAHIDETCNIPDGFIRIYITKDIPKHDEYDSIWIKEMYYYPNYEKSNINNIFEISNYYVLLCVLHSTINARLRHTVIIYENDAYMKKLESLIYNRYDIIVYHIDDDITIYDKRKYIEVINSIKCNENYNHDLIKMHGFLQ